MEKDDYEDIREHAGDLTMAYDLYFTTYEKNILVDAMVVHGNTVVGYCSRRQEHRRSMEEHIQDTIRKNGHPVTVRLMEDLRPFLGRLDSMGGASGGAHDGQIRQILLAIAL